MIYDRVVYLIERFGDKVSLSYSTHTIKKEEMLFVIVEKRRDLFEFCLSSDQLGIIVWVAFGNHTGCSFDTLLLALPQRVPDNAGSFFVLAACPDYWQGVVWCVVREYEQSLRVVVAEGVVWKKSFSILLGQFS